MLKVMTFNIRYGLADDGENRWDNRKSLALARIHAFDPDLLGVQECRDDTQAEFVKNNLPDYQFRGVHRGGDGSTTLEMAPLMYRNARFRPVRQGYFWLSETPHVPGSKSWDSDFPRTATWEELIDQQTGKTVTFLNTHFDYRPEAIEKSAQLLRQWAEEQEQPFIITGDFNANKHSNAYQLLTKTGLLLDAYRQVHPENIDDATFHAYGQPDQLSPIDWVLISDHFNVVDAAIDRSNAGGLFPSDHYPVTATLDWK